MHALRANTSSTRPAASPPTLSTPSLTAPTSTLAAPKILCRKGSFSIVENGNHGDTLNISFYKEYGNALHNRVLGVRTTKPINVWKPVS